MNNLLAIYWILVGIIFSFLGFAIYRVSFWAAKAKPKKTNDDLSIYVNNLRERTFKLEWKDHPLYDQDECNQSVILVCKECMDLIAISSVNENDFFNRTIYIKKEKLSILIKELIKIGQDAKQNETTN
jgi:hypothetical protein